MFSAGLYPQLKAHLAIGKEHGLTKTEVVEAITQLAFYCGWPKAWSAFPLVQEVYGDEEGATDGMPSNLSAFPVGEPNTAYAQYFIGKSYLAPISSGQVPVSNVTFEPGCRNNWHIHHAESGGGQMLVCMSGRGWYQEWGEAPRELHPGDVVNIPAGVKHWHGATAAVDHRQRQPSFRVLLEQRLRSAEHELLRSSHYGRGGLERHAPIRVVKGRITTAMLRSASRCPLRASKIGARQTARGSAMFLGSLPGMAR